MTFQYGDNCMSENKSSLLSEKIPRRAEGWWQPLSAMCVKVKERIYKSIRDNQRNQHS